MVGLYVILITDAFDFIYLRKSLLSPNARLRDVQMYKRQTRFKWAGMPTERIAREVSLFGLILLLLRVNAELSHRSYIREIYFVLRSPLLYKSFRTFVYRSLSLAFFLTSASFIFSPTRWSAWLKQLPIFCRGSACLANAFFFSSEKFE